MKRESCQHSCCAEAKKPTKRNDVSSCVVGCGLCVVAVSQITFQEGVRVAVVLALCAAVGLALLLIRDDVMK